MNRVRTAITMIASGLFSVLAEAASPLWFSMDLGAAGPLSQDNYSAQIREAGIDASLSDTDSFRGGVRLGAGTDLNTWLPLARPWRLSAQLEYFSLGVVSPDYSGSSSDSGAFYRELKDIHPESADYGFAASLSGSWRGLPGGFSPLRLGGRMGMSLWHQTYRLYDSNNERVGSDSLSGLSPLAGLEAGWRVSEYMNLRGGWTVYWLDSESAQLFSLGLEYHPWGQWH